jgi:hypothetical protein
LSPDNRQHRGAHPADAQLFAPDKHSSLCAATGELSWLLSRGYASTSALKLVGDRHHLTERQRLAVSRAVCTDAQRDERARRRLALESIRNEPLLIDGFNLIITIEAALGGGVLLRCRDGCLRDLASVHGSYRSVRETDRAIGLIGEALEVLRPASVEWFLDKPISNSGRLAQRIRELAEANGWNWSVEVLFNPDARLSSSNGIIVTSDSLIIDRAVKWVDFNNYLIGRMQPLPWIVDLSPES